MVHIVTIEGNQAEIAEKQNMNKQIAEKIAAEYNKIDKARVWNKSAYSRVYVGKNGRYIEVGAGGAADVTGMVIRQAREGAAMICGKLGIVVTAK